MFLRFRNSVLTLFEDYSESFNYKSFFFINKSIDSYSLNKRFACELD